MQFERILSPSAVNLYLQCPRKFYYRYILKLPMKDSIHTLRGSILHTVLENMFDFDISKMTNVNYRKVLHEQVLKMFEDEWGSKQQKLDALGLSKQDLEFYYDDSIDQLDKWLDKLISMIDKKLKEVFMIRLAWKYFMPKYRELKLESKSIGVMGYIDQVLSIGERDCVIDYKTSKSPHITPEYSLQLAVYNMLYNERFGIVPDTYIWFLKFGLKKVGVGEFEIRDAKSKIEIVHEALRKKAILDYPKNITPLCKWENANGSGQCDFYDKCFLQQTL